MKTHQIIMRFQWAILANRLTEDPGLSIPLLGVGEYFPYLDILTIFAPGIPYVYR